MRTLTSRTRYTIGLALIVIAFVVIAGWNLGDAGYSSFYSSAAHSMAVSWRAFLFGAYNPDATVTLDKLSGFLVPQALSARLFGFSAWSIALPQVIEGAVTIVACYLVAARWRGRAAGITAALMMASTPLAASMFGHIMEDGLLTMSLALALLSLQSALRSGRTLPLLVSAGWIGVGFQAKMLQAWLPLPAFAIALLLVGSATFGRRLGRAAIFLAVAIAVSLSWMIVVQLIPAGSRPYIDGSTNNNVFSMVFGYNGINRLIPGFIPGAAPDFVGSVIRGSDPGASAAKLLLPTFLTQVGWLFPLALAGILLSFVAQRIRRGIGAADGRGQLAILTALVGWLVVVVLILSAATVPHTAYFAALSVQVAVLAAVGWIEAAALLRSPRLLARLILPALIALETVWTVAILVGIAVAPAWMVAAVAVIGLGSSVGLAFVAVRFARRTGTGRDSDSDLDSDTASAAGTSIARPPASRLIAIALAGCLLAPVAWTASTLDPALAGSPNDAYAGPRTDRVPGFFRSPGTLQETSTFEEFSVAPPVFARPSPALSAERIRLVNWLREHGGTPALLITSSWDSAHPYLLAEGLPVIPIGGFSGSIPTPTVEQVKALVRNATARYLLLPDPLPVSSRTTAKQSIENWAARSCALVPPDSYNPGGQDADNQLARQSVWDCRASGTN